MSRSIATPNGSVLNLRRFAMLEDLLVQLGKPHARSTPSSRLRTSTFPSSRVRRPTCTRTVSPVRLASRTWSQPAGDEDRPVDRRRYLPREVFFGRFGGAGCFFSVWVSDFGRFFP